jgi:hypothetical protein
LLKKFESMNAKPEVVQFVMEKLAIPRWLKMMEGYIKGKPWHRWTGQAREAGRVKVQQFKTQEALAERARLGPQAASRKRVLGGTIDRTTMDIRKRLAKVKDIRHRQLLIGSAGKGDPMLRTTPGGRQVAVQDLMKTLKMSKPGATRNVLGLPSKPVSFPQPGDISKGMFAKRFRPHMIPPKGQTGVFKSLYERAPTLLQQSPRFQVPMDVVKARSRGAATLPPVGIKLPSPTQYTKWGDPIIERATTRAV